MGHLLTEVTTLLNDPTTKDKVIITRSRSWIYFEIPCWISKGLAARLQQELGYHPCGYGFYGHQCTPTKTTWKCYRSCD